MSDDDAPKPSGASQPDPARLVETQTQLYSEAPRPSPSRLLKDTLIGSTVSGYVVKGKIGSGGMGLVYEAEQAMIGKRVAIKVLRPEIADKPEQVKRLVEEARAVNTVGHRGIIDVFGFAQVNDGRQCIVMEYLEGEPLSDLLKRNRAERKLMPVADAMSILEEVLSALAAAHGAGVIHRDLKPSNIFLCKQRDGSRYVKLLDFGIAKLGVNTAGTESRESTLVGTPAYMAPEQARGGTLGAGMDLYAVGVITFEMLTGQLPFEGATGVEMLMMHAETPAPRPSSKLMSIPDDVDELVVKLLAKTPELRQPSAEQVRLEVVQARKGLAGSTARRTALEVELEVKKRLSSIIVPESGQIDVGGEDATSPPMVRNGPFRLPQQGPPAPAARPTDETLPMQTGSRPAVKLEEDDERTLPPDPLLADTKNLRPPKMIDDEDEKTVPSRPAPIAPGEGEEKTVIPFPRAATPGEGEEKTWKPEVRPPVAPPAAASEPPKKSRAMMVAIGAVLAALAAAAAFFSMR